MANGEKNKPSGVAYLALVLVIVLIIAVIVGYVFIFVRREVEIFGVNLKQVDGASTGTSDTFNVSENDIYVSRNSTALTLTLSFGNGVPKGRVISVKNNGPKTTDIITLTAGSGITLQTGQLTDKVNQGQTAELLATTDSGTFLRLQ